MFQISGIPLTFQKYSSAIGSHIHNCGMCRSIILQVSDGKLMPEQGIWPFSNQAKQAISALNYCTATMYLRSKASKKYPSRA